MSCLRRCIKHASVSSAYLAPRILSTKSPLHLVFSTLYIVLDILTVFLTKRALSCLIYHVLSFIRLLLIRFSSPQIPAFICKLHVHRKVTLGFHCDCNFRYDFQFFLINVILQFCYMLFRVFYSRYDFQFFLINVILQFCYICCFVYFTHVMISTHFFLTMLSNSSTKCSLVCFVYFTHVMISSFFLINAILQFCYTCCFVYFTHVMISTHFF